MSVRTVRFPKTFPGPGQLLTSSVLKKTQENQTTSIEDDLNGRQPLSKTTSMEDDLNGRRTQWKTNSMEDELNGRRSQWKTTKMEEDLKGIQH